ncbi:hypothetical protein G4B88_008518 [Cannabis sativa]|uniref:Uncharacterized protein n=1 Tax=Cannabis sativa TaxID=3483 RepID=A0A7J6EGW6_CANSA|nr:hypothetical protein G4B88_008518 [Cannabis sativa]
MGDWIHTLLNIAVPPIIIFLHFIILPIYIPFKFLQSIKRSITNQENMARRVVLITGAAQGIGEQIAYEYGRRGACLTLVDIKDNLEEVKRKAHKLGSPDVISIVADVTKVEDCKRFIDETVQHFGQLDHLVNNAGTVILSKFEKIGRISDHQSVMDVNFWGTVNSIHYGIPHLKRSKGKIVVISSICGRYPLPLVSVYNASKAALISFCETLRIEVGSTIGITVGLKLRSVIPEESAEDCGKAIVRSVCRGETYLMEPKWLWWLFPMKMMFPELMDYCTRFLLKLIQQNNNKNN